MSSNYKFHNPDGVYFVTFTTVYWMDVFTRELYFDEVINTLKFCQNKKGMELFSWVIMTNHVHLVFRAREGNPSEIMRSLKTFTSNQLQKIIVDNPKESRKKWMVDLMVRAAESRSNVKHKQFWIHENHPIELWSEKVTYQKVDYIHNNPVVAGFVRNPEDWKYSSAIDFAGGKGLLDLCEL